MRYGLNKAFVVLWSCDLHFCLSASLSGDFSGTVRTAVFHLVSEYLAVHWEEPDNSRLEARAKLCFPDCPLQWNRTTKFVNHHPLRDCGM
eukprot:3751098-Amphidinium_carterae.2